VYKKEEVHDAMKRLFDVDFSHREMLELKNFREDCFVYNTKSEDFKMLVFLKDGSFDGYEPRINALVPPHGNIQGIKGM
jgi:hypothetical protein